MIIVSRVVTFKLFLLEKSIAHVETEEQKESINVHSNHGCDNDLVPGNEVKTYCNPYIYGDKEKPLKRANYDHFSILVPTVRNID